jgi:hypothetical protein
LWLLHCAGSKTRARAARWCTSEQPLGRTRTGVDPLQTLQTLQAEALA